MKELTSEQKLFILDRLKLGTYTKYNINGEMFYSESSVLQLIKEFNSVSLQENIREELIKFSNWYAIWRDRYDLKGEHMRFVVDEYLTSRPSDEVTDEMIDEWSKTLDYITSWSGLTTVRKGVMFGAKAMRDGKIREQTK
jgi:hypothetical protein